MNPNLDGFASTINQVLSDFQSKPMKSQKDLCEIFVIYVKNLK